jgi:predicted GNAT family acetyltransferase
MCRSKKFAHPSTNNCMHPLDNVIWNALTTRQKHFAEGNNSARKFIAEVSPLAAFQEENPAGYAALAELLAPGNTVGIFIDLAYTPQPGWSFLVGAPLLQMIWEDSDKSIQTPNPAPEIVELSTPDSPEMIELTALTKPGPFDTRTHEFGSYYGIRIDGKLAAMAGERLRVPGYTEVSAVCTHPDHTGKGYAAALMLRVMQGIRERGEIPFLHSRGDNTRAIALYRRLGFRERVLRHFAVLRKV